MYRTIAIPNDYAEGCLSNYTFFSASLTSEASLKACQSFASDFNKVVEEYRTYKLTQAEVIVKHSMILQAVRGGCKYIVERTAAEQEVIIRGYFDAELFDLCAKQAV